MVDDLVDDLCQLLAQGRARPVQQNSPELDTAFDLCNLTYSMPLGELDALKAFVLGDAGVPEPASGSRLADAMAMYRLCPSEREMILTEIDERRVDLGVGFPDDLRETIERIEDQALLDELESLANNLRDDWSYEEQDSEDDSAPTDSDEEEEEDPGLIACPKERKRASLIDPELHSQCHAQRPYVFLVRVIEAAQERMWAKTNGPEASE